jgi:hypothetical protein
MIPLINFPTYRQYNNITPFTVRDGATHLEVLESLRNWMLDTLVPYVDSEVTLLTDDFQTQVTSVITAVNAALVDVNTNSTTVAGFVATVTSLANNASASAAAAATSAGAAAGSAGAAATSETNAAASAATAATAGAAAGTTAGTTAGTAAGTTAGTAAGTTAGTSAGTTAGTAAGNAAITAQKNAANGIAGLDANSRIADAQLPTRVRAANRQIYTTATPTTLSAITDAVVGDQVLITTPGTGISPFVAECWSTPASVNSKWRPVTTIVADTTANLNTFIAAWIADTDLTFAVFSFMHSLDGNCYFRVTTTAGVKTLFANDLGAVAKMDMQHAAVAAGVTGSTIDTHVFPSLPFATRVMANLLARAGGNASLATHSLAVASSAGTPQKVLDTVQVEIAATKYADIVGAYYLDIPANTAATVTITSAISAGSSAWRLSSSYTRITTA